MKKKLQPTKPIRDLKSAGRYGEKASLPQKIAAPRPAKQRSGEYMEERLPDYAG